jgi:hypothetical protein
MPVVIRPQHVTTRLYDLKAQRLALFLQSRSKVPTRRTASKPYGSDDSNLQQMAAIEAEIKQLEDEFPPSRVTAW